MVQLNVEIPRQMRDWLNTQPLNKSALIRGLLLDFKQKMEKTPLLTHAQHILGLVGVCQFCEAQYTPREHDLGYCSQHCQDLAENGGH